MSINEVVICGRLTADAEVRATKSGKELVTFRIASDAYTGEGKHTNYFPCVYFNGGLAPYLKKGLKVTLEGSLQYSEWETENGKRSKIEIKVRQIELPPKESAKEQSSLYDEDMPF